MSVTNCWEFMKCGREPEGEKADELGICPAATEVRLEGINKGKNGGRACWLIEGTTCDDKLQGAFMAKFKDCIFCDFYKMVMEEEGSSVANSFKVLSLLKS